MKTPDTEKLYQEKELAYQMKATGNRSQTDHTPDTEWEKEFDKEWLETGCNSYGVATKGVVKDMFARLLTSRDTYWKERVRKEVEGMKQPETHEDHCDGYCNESACYLPDRIASNRTLDTLLDNLK